MTATDYIAIARDMVLMGTALATSCIAILGINKWRQELTGKAEFEAARNLARATYKLRNELHYCRSRTFKPWEFSGSSAPDPKTADAQDVVKAWAHAYQTRFDHVQNAFAELNAQVLEAEVHGALSFGQQPRNWANVRRLVDRLTHSNPPVSAGRAALNSPPQSAIH